MKRSSDVCWETHSDCNEHGINHEQDWIGVLQSTQKFKRVLYATFYGCNNKIAHIVTDRWQDE